MDTPNTIAGSLTAQLMVVVCKHYGPSDPSQYNRVYEAALNKFESLEAQLTAAQSQIAALQAEVDRLTNGPMGVKHLMTSRELLHGVVSDQSSQIAALSSALVKKDEKLKAIQKIVVGTPFPISADVAVLAIEGQCVLAATCADESAKLREELAETKKKSLPFDEHVKEILSWMCFQIKPYADMLRAEGLDIPRKAEAEQAAVLHWMLNLYLAHGSDWKKAGQEWIEKHIAARADAGGDKQLARQHEQLSGTGGNMSAKTDVKQPVAEPTYHNEVFAKRMAREAKESEDMQARADAGEKLQ